MLNLSYKTRYDDDPTGKQSVFFACHPDDFDKCFDETAKDIFASQNCAIYYIDKDAEAEYAEYDEKQKAQCMNELSDCISETRLFVIPVTVKLLTRPSLALDIFGFLQEKNDIHIPVLPLIRDGLMSDKGLAALYNRTFGDLQALDKYGVDETAIPFKKKLEGYLSSVLVGDELAEKVRAAFSAYIFLSYRKKDRAYAKELMRLIHKNKFCRDIAIWYDEFLKPGEGFNGAIEDAVEKCNLFALTVTPSLLEDGNYVMTKEYPMARKIGKTILPAEIVLTDRGELEKKYEGIPACTDANDMPKLAAELRSALGNAACRRNDTDPEHDFLIGLAYLAGIDVEVDVDCALEMITCAAEAGVEAAVKKLVDMYRIGDGVGRNLLRAATWQEKLAEICEQRYRESGSDDDRLRLADELMESGYLRLYCGDLRAADVWCKKAKIIYEDIYDLHARLNLISVYCGMGQIKESMWKSLEDGDGNDGNIEEAIEYYKKALNISKKLANETNEPEMRRNISVIYGMLSELFRIYREFDKAFEYGKEALNIAAALAKETKTPEASRWLLICNVRLGEICVYWRRNAEARGYYEDALKICEPLVKKVGDVEERRDLMAACRGLGSVSEAEGRLAEARGYHEKAFETAAALAEETKTPEAREDLSDCCAVLGDICKEEGRLTDALRYYEQFHEQAKAAVDDAEDIGKTESDRLSSRLAVSYEKLGDTAFEEGFLGNAEKCYRQWLDIMFPYAYEKELVCISEYEMFQVAAFEKLGDTALRAGRLADALDRYMKAKNFSVMLFGEELGETGEIFERFGDIASAEGMLSRAEEYYKRSLRIMSAPDTPNTAEAGDRARILDKLGDICRAERQRERAFKYYKEALEIRKELADKTEAVAAHRDFVMSYEKIVDAADACGRLTDALKHYNNILELRLRLVKRTETSGPRSDLARSYDMFGDFYRSNGQPDRAREYYKKALGIREKIAKKSEAVEARLAPALSYDKLGDTAMAAGHADEAREYYKKAFGVKRRLADETKMAVVSRALARSYEKLGDAAKMEHMPDEARDFYDNSVRIRRKLADNTKTVEARLELALICEKLGTLNNEEAWYDEALESYEEALSVRTDLEKETGTVEARRELAGIYDMIGGIFGSQGPLYTACDYYEKSLEIKEKLEAETKTRESQLDLFRICDKLGDIAFGNLHIDDARKYYKQAHEAALSLAAKYDDDEVLEVLSRSYFSLGSIAKLEGSHDDELKYNKKAHELAIERLADAETIDDNDRRELANSYNALGDIAKEEKRFADAREYYKKLLDLRLALENKTRRAKGHLDVIAACIFLGETAEMQGCLGDARKYFLDAMGRASALFEKTNDQEARRAVLVCCIDLGDIAKKERNKRGEARKYFERAIVAGRRLERETDGAEKAEASRYIFVTCMRLGEMAEEDKQTDEARRYYSEACVFATAAAEYMKTDQSYHELALSHYTLGTFEEHRIDREHVLAALEIWSSLAKSYPENDEYAKMRDKCRELLDQ